LTRPPVEAVILDMDGLLIDTEPAWRAAESAVFAGLGVLLSKRDLLDSTGQPIETLIPVWRRRQPPDSDRRPELTDPELADPELTDPELTDAELTDPELADPELTDPELTDAELTGAELTDIEVADRITDQVIAHVMAQGQPMPGVTAAIALFERCGLPLAIASSSPLRLIDAVCVRLGLSE
jgi:beta-phosphoglucomutase-like phosphatase (HAD superfamily)